MKTLFTFTLVYFFVWFANFCLEIVEWSGVTKIELLTNFLRKLLLCLVLN